MKVMELEGTLTFIGDGKFKLRCEKLNMEVFGRVPAPVLCKAIINLSPSFKEGRLRVCLPTGDHCYTVLNIGRHAKYSYAENVNGINLVKYVPFPKQSIRRN